MFKYIIVFILLLLWVGVYFTRIRGVYGGSDPPQWVEFRDWDGLTDIDPSGTDVMVQTTPRRPQAGDPKAPVGFPQSWIYDQADGSKLLVYYRLPCRMFRRLYVSPGSAINYGGVTVADKLKVRDLIKAVNPRSSLLGQEVKTSGQPYIALPQVVEFEFGLLFDKGPLGVAAKMDGYPFAVVCAGDLGLLSIRRYVRMGFPWSGPPMVCAGELVDKTFWIFDVMIINGLDITNQPFAERMIKAPDVQKLLASSWLGIDIKIQQFYSAHEERKAWLESIDQAWTARTNLKTDGLIIQAMNQPYDKTLAMKFKPYTELSIDISHSGNRYLSAKGDACQVERGPPAPPADPPQIVEVNLHENKIIKIRHGKPNANAAKTVAQIRDLYDIKLGLRDLKGETIEMMKAYMRYFEAKNLYNLVPNGSKILDIGAGVGRSRDNWRAHNYKVWAIEPNPESYARLKNRPGIQTMNMGGEDPRLKTWIRAGSMDGIFMVHSLTFFNEDGMRALAKNIAHCLRPGGKIVGIGLDGIEVKKKLDVSSIDNEAFSITNVGSNRVSITMKHGRSLVNAQTEYMIDYEVWTRIMIESGFKLISTHMMPGSYLLAADPLWFARSTRVWAFERLAT